ncbi:hypothetical protein RQP46_011055 [Phenoliferia psychrophenolica]
MFKTHIPTQAKCVAPNPQTMDSKIAELEVQLATADDTAAMGHYRGFCDWATRHVADAVDIITLVPPTAPFAPVAKLVLAIFVLAADGKGATEALQNLESRLVEIYRDLLPLREQLEEVKPILDGIETIFEEVYVYIKGQFKKTQIPALSRIEIIGLRTEAVLTTTAGEVRQTRDMTVDILESVRNPIQPQVM